MSELLDTDWPPRSDFDFMTQDQLITEIRKSKRRQLRLLEKTMDARFKIDYTRKVNDQRTRIMTDICCSYRAGDMLEVRNALSQLSEQLLPKEEEPSLVNKASFIFLKGEDQ